MVQGVDILADAEFDDVRCVGFDTDDIEIIFGSSTIDVDLTSSVAVELLGPDFLESFDECV